MQEFVNSSLDLRAAEECSDEFSGAVRFVAAAESARNHDDLCLLNQNGKEIDGFFDGSSRQVPDDKDLRSCAGTFEDTCCIIFTVCPREYRNQNTWMCNLDGAGLDFLPFIEVSRRNGNLALDLAGEYRFQFPFPYLQQVIQLERIV